MTSFLQYEGFGETVLRQAGEEAETDPDKGAGELGQSAPDRVGGGRSFLRSLGVRDVESGTV